jgi:DNA primase
MEGFMDVIALHRANIPQAIALMGTAVTPTHIKLLQNLGVEIRICLDQDAAGQTAMMKMMTPLTQTNVPFRFVVSEKETRDADEILLADGETGLKNYLNQLVAKMDFSFHFYQQVMPLTSTEQRVAFINRMLPLIVVTPPLEQIDYLRRLGQLTQYATKDLQTSLNKLAKKETDFFQTYRPEAKVLNRLKRAEKAILYNMFLSGEAIDIFQRDVKFFHDDIYRQIAMYLIEIYQSDPPDHQALINHISMSDAKDQQVIINTIAELMSEKNLPKADNHQLHDYLNTLKEERDKLVKAHHIKSSIAGKPDTEQARIIKELHKQVKPEQKGEIANEETEEKDDETKS